jgi:hypothetical protein
METNYIKPIFRTFTIFIFIVSVLIHADARTVRSVQSGKWNAVSTWSTRPVPGAGDSVIIENGHIVELNVAVTVRSLTLSLGHLIGSKDLSVNNTLTLINGSLGNASNITVLGNFDMREGIIGNLGGTVGGFVHVKGQITFISGGALAFKKFIHKKELIVNNVFSWNGGDIKLAFGGKITVNTGGGRFQSSGSSNQLITGNGLITINGTYINNTNTVIDSGVIVNNTGHISNPINANLSLLGGGSHTGIFTNDGTILFKGTHQVTNIVTPGSGVFNIGFKGKMVLNANQSFNNLTLSGGGMLTGNFALTVNTNLILEDGLISNGSSLVNIKGNLVWSKGGFENLSGSSGAITILGTNTMNSNGIKTIRHKKMTWLTTEWTGGNISLSDSAAIVIAQGFEFTVNPTASVNITGDGSLTVLGKMINVSNQQITMDNIKFENQGLVIQGNSNLNTGRLSIFGGTSIGIGTQTGKFDVPASGGIIQFGGSLKWNGAQSTGTGRLIISGDINLISNATISNLTVDIVEGGYIHGNQSARFTGNVSIHGGILASGVSTTIDGSFTYRSGIIGDPVASINDSLIVKGPWLMGDAFNKDIYVRYSIAHGNVTWTKGVINMRNNFFIIMPNSTFSTLSDVSKVDSFKATVINQGTIAFLNDQWLGTSVTNLGTVTGQSISIGETFNHFGLMMPSTILQGKRIEMSTFSRLQIGIRGNNGADAAFGNDVMRSKNSIAKINGEVVLQLQNGFVPGAGMSFSIFESNLGYSGQFTSVSGNTTPGFSWKLIHQPTQVLVQYCPVLYFDNDRDGFGNPQDSIISCDPVDGYVSLKDCDDTNSNSNPNATEICNGIDDNCDGKIDNDCFAPLPGLESRSAHMSKVFPNPSTGIIYIAPGDFEKKKVLYQLSDMNGKVIYQSETRFDVSPVQLKLQGENIVQGTYALKLVSGGNSKTLKIVLIH